MSNTARKNASQFISSGSANALMGGGGWSYDKCGTWSHQWLLGPLVASQDIAPPPNSSTRQVSSLLGLYFSTKLHLSYQELVAHIVGKKK